jgi:arsenate reductase (glutaredoxin)
VTTLWMKSSCTTCRDARAELQRLGLTFEVRDYYRKPLERAELEALLPEDPNPWLGNRSPKYRELGLKDRRLTRDEAIALVLEDCNLLKRPLLVHPGGAILGFDREAYGALRP